MTIERYIARGQPRYRFKCYLGICPKTGKEKHTTRSGFKTKLEARQAYTRLMEEQASPVAREYFKDTYDKWQKIYKATVKETTYASTTAMFTNHILPYIGDYYTDSIDVYDIEDLAEKLESKLSTHRVILQYVSRVFDLAVRDRVREDNPVKIAILPKQTTKRDRTNFYNRRQMVDFLAACKEHLSLQWHTYFRLLAFTGMRKSEALALTWEDLGNFEITVNKTLAAGIKGRLYVSEPKTAMSKRTILLDRDTTELLIQMGIAQRKWLGDNQYLMFPNESGNYTDPGYPNVLLNRVIDRAGLPTITVHGLRHTHASLLLESGASIKAVQERLGHSSYKITMDIYAHMTEESTANVMEAFIAHLS